MSLRVICPSQIWSILLFLGALGATYPSVAHGQSSPTVTTCPAVIVDLIERENTLILPSEFENFASLLPVSSNGIPLFVGQFILETNTPLSLKDLATASEELRSHGLQILYDLSVTAAMNHKIRQNFVVSGNIYDLISALSVINGDLYFDPIYVTEMDVQRVRNGLASSVESYHWAERDYDEALLKAKDDLTGGKTVLINIRADGFFGVLVPEKEMAWDHRPEIPLSSPLNKDPTGFHAAINLIGASKARGKITFDDQSVAYLLGMAEFERIQHRTSSELLKVADQLHFDKSLADQILGDHPIQETDLAEPAVAVDSSIADVFVNQKQGSLREFTRRVNRFYDLGMAEKIFLKLGEYLRYDLKDTYGKKIKDIGFKPYSSRMVLVGSSIKSQSQFVEALRLLAESYNYSHPDSPVDVNGVHLKGHVTELLNRLAVPEKIAIVQNRP